MSADEIWQAGIDWLESFVGNGSPDDQEGAIIVISMLAWVCAGKPIPKKFLEENSK